ncbi:MAG: hypothetical protein JW809_14045 [Pirellulales bacterium]|nr:hypothetical protein [Pirellulales bacterium]
MNEDTNASSAKSAPEPARCEAASGSSGRVVGERAADPNARLRRGVYAIFIALSVGAMLGRILAVDAVDRTAVENDRIAKALGEKRAQFTQRGLAGDALAEALAKEETRLRERIRLRRPFLSANDRSRLCAVRALVEPEMRVPDAPYAIDRVIQEPGWDTIDMVKHDGHVYSSKPPLLSTLLAGEYWVIHRLTGATLGTHPYEIGRFLLVTANVVPLALMMCLVAAMAEWLGTTDWGRLFVVGAAAFGTFLTTFAIVLNNHTLGAAGAMVALWAGARIWFDGKRSAWYFLLAGFAGAFTVTNDLPALAFLAALGGVLLLKAPRPTLFFFVPAVAVVAAAFFGTNWIAHEDLRPPYMHRVEGDNWYDYTYERNGRQIESYWRNPVGLDRGEPSDRVYALHALVGHHGIFSLTPMWLLSVAGVLVWLVRGDRNRRELAVLVGGVSVVCLVFFLFLETHGRNYGGMSCGFRWVFWLAPLWLVVMLPAADAMARRGWTQALALVLLAASVLSASYPTWNPWTHPWLLDYLHYLGWIQV